MLFWLGLRDAYERIDPADFNVCFKGSVRPVITIGDQSYANRMRIYCWRPGLGISFGNYCSIAEDVAFLLGGEHDVQWVSTYPFFERWAIPDEGNLKTLKSRGSIIVEHDVWIGHGATILSGTRIGIGAIVGAGSVLRGTVPPYAIMAGNPAKLIRYRFSEEIRNGLLASAWWDQPRSRLTELAIHMHDPEEFLRQLARAGAATPPTTHP